MLFFRSDQEMIDRAAAWILQKKAEGADRQHRLTVEEEDAGEQHRLAGQTEGVCEEHDPAGRKTDLLENARLLEQKADNLKARINEKFWNASTGRYDYLFDSQGRCENSEALGLAFSILYGIADEEKTDSIVRSTLVLQEGIPVVWPAFRRYCLEESDPEKNREETGGNPAERRKSTFRHYGRHSGTVWPHAQAYWALAMKKIGQGDAA